MKNKIILLFLVFSSYFLEAQKLSLGIKYGGVSSFPKVTSSIDQNTRKSAYAGLSLEYKSKLNYTLSTGFEIQYLGFYNYIFYCDHPDDQVDGFDGPCQNLYPSTYYSFPILFGKCYGDKFFIQPKVGVVFNRLHYVKYFGDRKNIQNPKFDLGLTGQLSAGWNITKNFSLAANAAYQHGTLDFLETGVYKDSKDFNRSFFYSLEFKYGFYLNQLFQKTPNSSSVQDSL